MSKLSDAIVAAVKALPDSEKQKLAQAIEDYAAQYKRTWDGMTRGSTSAGVGPCRGRFVSDLLEDLVEVTDARPGWEPPED